MGRLGQQLDQFRDAWAAWETGRAAAASADFAFEQGHGKSVHDVQAGVSFAFHGQQLVARAEALLEHRNAEGAPQHIAIVGRESGLTVVGERDYRMFEEEIELRNSDQLIKRRRDGGGRETLHSLVPSMRKNTDLFRRHETSR